MPAASALLEDLQRFQQKPSPLQHGRRPYGELHGAVKWVRRHPTHAAILAASLVVAILLVGGGFWLALQQAHRRNGVETDLTGTARPAGCRWAEARERAAKRRAQSAEYQGGGPDDLRLRIAGLVAISTSSSSLTRSASSVQPAANWHSTRPGPIASIARRSKVPDWERVAAPPSRWLPHQCLGCARSARGRSL